MTTIHAYVYSGPHYGRPHLVLAPTVLPKGADAPEPRLTGMVLVEYEPTREQYWVPACDCEVER